MDNQIKELRENDPHLKALFEFIIARRLGSVPGIGVVTASEIILATNEFTTISEPKKLACHAGVAPFEQQSGTSVRGKTSVNHHSRKRHKSLFHLAAMSSVKVKGEIRDYDMRKVAEGKNKCLC
ncbi:IS110 family transposase [Dyadobacter flavalbus]|uniref:IS110 family transposase n=1 Tax=Dyadobacter flavalbus TaxID=2579942 RepID=UPI001E4B77B4|nr:IS110 family transposase [Dyadobacter flavalbus]